MTTSAERTQNGQEARRDWSSIRCVLWHAPDTDPPEDLWTLLARRGLEPVCATSAYEALALLCRRARELRHEGRLGPLALLTCQPERLDGFDDVVAAARLYVPHAACWVDDPGGSPRLRAVGSAAPPKTEAPEIHVRNQPPQEPAAAPEPPARPASGPDLRITDNEVEGPLEPTAPESRTILTDEELAMLLADDR